jgi:hypothetical protein
MRGRGLPGWEWEIGDSSRQSARHDEQTTAGKAHHHRQSAAARAGGKHCALTLIAIQRHPQKLVEPGTADSLWKSLLQPPAPMILVAPDTSRNCRQGSDHEWPRDKFVYFAGWSPGKSEKTAWPPTFSSLNFCSSPNCFRSAACHTSNVKCSGLCNRDRRAAADFRPLCRRSIFFLPDGILWILAYPSLP